MSSWRRTGRPVRPGNTNEARSRFTRRTGWTAGIALVVSAVMGLSQAAHADGAASGAADRQSAAVVGAAVTASDFNLAAGGDLSGLDSQLDAALPKQGVQNLLLQANRDLTTGSSCAVNPFGGTALAPVQKYCWQSDDQNTTEWVPQAITGVDDAQDDEEWGSARPVLTAWYDNSDPGRSDGCTASESDACNEKGVRVTFLDPSTLKYRHVLLVWPYTNSAGHASFDALHAKEGQDPPQNGIHAGGIAWYGNYLYVADTLNGLRVFDMRYIMDLDPDQDPSTNDSTPDGLTSNVQDTRQVGRENNVWYSYGYRYVMPQVATWSFTAAQSNTSADTCAASGAPKASWLSIDRTGNDTLSLGEYCNSDSTHTEKGRIAQLPLDAATGELTATSGVVHATDAYNMPVDLVQGGVRYGSSATDETYYFDRSNGTSNGSVQKAKVSGSSLADTGSPTVTAVGPEDLYLDRNALSGTPAPLLWSLSERSSATGTCAASPAPCGRVVYAQSLAAINGT